MPSSLSIADYIGSFPSSPLARLGNLNPWELTSEAPAIVRQLMTSLSGEDFIIEGDIARHRSATVEPGAVLKGPLVLGAHCFVGAGAYLRGGNWLDEDCIIGPGSELKSSFVFARTKLAHFNFVGDSVVGSNVNIEAGSVVCNYRNERADHEIRIRLNGSLHQAGVENSGRSSATALGSAQIPSLLPARFFCRRRSSGALAFSIRKRIFDGAFRVYQES